MSVWVSLCAKGMSTLVPIAIGFASAGATWGMCHTPYSLKLSDMHYPEVVWLWCEDITAPQPKWFQSASGDHYFWLIEASGGKRTHPPSKAAQAPTQQGLRWRARHPTSVLPSFICWCASLCSSHWQSLKAPAPQMGLGCAQAHP